MDALPYAVRHIDTGPVTRHARRMSLLDLLLPITLGEACSLGLVTGFAIATLGFWASTPRRD